MLPFISNAVTMPTVGTMVNTNQPTGESTPKESDHGTSPLLTHTASGQFSFLNARTITPAPFNPIPSQGNANKHPILQADAALQHAQGDSDTNKAKVYKTDALSSKVPAIFIDEEIVPLNSPESNHKEPKLKDCKTYVCKFMINHNTQQFCDLAFSLLGELKNHMKTHTKRQRHCCQFCQKIYKTPYKLKRHQRTHTGEKPFLCDICGAAFSDSSNFTKHKRAHTPIKSSVQQSVHTKS